VNSSADIVFDSALKKYKPPIEPRYVLLFSGHMIDAPGRKEARFPPEKEREAAEAIAIKLDELKTGEKDLALCGGACGGDLLFAEACDFVSDASNWSNASELIPSLFAKLLNSFP